MNLHSDSDNYKVGRRPRVVLRADAGSRIGMGHFVRTCALAAYLADEFECVIASRNPDSGQLTRHQLDMIAEAGASVAPISKPDMSGFDRDFLNFLRSDDIVVLDNYYYPTHYQTAVRNACHALVCIDDVHDRHFTADVVMTFCPLTRSDFSLEDYTLFRGGMQWAFLRRPFLAPAPRRTTADLQSPRLRVVTAMGGADPYRLTDKMVSIISDELPMAHIDVIAGSSVVTDCIDNPNVTVWREADAATIARIFDDCNFGVFPASTICVEALSRRLPILAGYYVDNQKEIYADGVRRGRFAPLDNLLDDASAIAKRLHNAVNNLPSPAPIDFGKQCENIKEIFRQLRDKR